MQLATVPCQIMQQMTSTMKKYGHIYVSKYVEACVCHCVIVCGNKKNERDGYHFWGRLSWYILSTIDSDRRSEKVCRRSVLRLERGGKGVRAFRGGGGYKREQRKEEKELWRSFPRRLLPASYSFVVDIYRGGGGHKREEREEDKEMRRSFPGRPLSASCR